MDVFAKLKQHSLILDMRTVIQSDDDGFYLAPPNAWKDNFVGIASKNGSAEHEKQLVELLNYYGFETWRRDNLFTPEGHTTDFKLIIFKRKGYEGPDYPA
jgi:hypothetical protein